MLTAALKRLTKHSVVYALGPAVHKVIGFLLLPLVTAWIGSRGNYGVVEMASVTLAVSAQVLGINLLQGMARYWAGYETEAAFSRAFNSRWIRRLLQQGLEPEAGKRAFRHIA